MVGGTASTEAKSGWYRLAALGIATLFVLCGVAAIAAVYERTVGSDFVAFWAAGRLALEGNAQAAYDIARHHAVELQAEPMAGILPFPYPPFALALFMPFAVFPFPIAFALWLVLSVALYVVVSSRCLEPRFSLAQAAAAANFITGQNGFLTAGIFIGGTNQLAGRPFLAGAILGLLSLKPQLAVLLPIALLAGREWRAVAGGILSSAALLIAGLVLFGADAYSGFLSLISEMSEWLSKGRLPPWGEFASTFALLRWFGVPQTMALVVHGIVALGAAAVTARAWIVKSDQRVAILAAATLLISPYLFTYDALLLTVPISELLAQPRRKAVFGGVWVLSLLPVIAYVAPFPNTIPLAAMLALWALHSDGRAGRLTKCKQI